ncbi:MAG: YkgJ family cysteine cluster protein [Desulfobacterales bacterium]|jgi:Fe-S-cluster containining protein
MNIAAKLTILDQIYSIYEEFANTLELACKKQCSFCCTTNVLLTTLEGYKIIDTLISNDKFDAIKKIITAPATARYRPELTTNQIAKMCADGRQLPEEVGTQNWEECFFLIDNECPIYELRPFGCRCLVSRHNCGEKGYAEVDDFVISVNTVILQTIEHADVQGCTGNLVDVLGVLSSENNQEAYRSNALTCQKSGLIPNYPLTVLMIPPEHRTRMEPILQKLRQLKF